MIANESVRVEEVVKILSKASDKYIGYNKISKVKALSRWAMICCYPYWWISANESAYGDTPVWRRYELTANGVGNREDMETRNQISVGNIGRK